MDDTTGTILVGHDGSADADLAIKWAARAALLEGVGLQVAVIEDLGALPGVAWWPEDYWTEVEDRARQGMTRAGVEASTVTRRRGAVVPTLTALAHDASLVVLGSRGHSRAGGLFVGSVSQHLARHAPCPVVVVAPPKVPPTASQSDSTALWRARQPSTSPADVPGSPGRGCPRSVPPGPVRCTWTARDCCPTRWERS